MEEKFDDYWKISYDMAGYNKFISTILPLQNQEITKFTLLILPTSLDVLINEYDSKFNSNLEFRDIFSANRKIISKINIIKKYIDNCIALNSTLYITDPYLFPNNYDCDYPNLLIDLLSYTKSNVIKIITHSNYNKDLFDATKIKINKCGKEIQLFTSKQFHDRFWITDKTRGFVMGTSLNGIGKKISCINELNSVDVMEIYREIQSIK